MDFQHDQATFTSSSSSDFGDDFFWPRELGGECDYYHYAQDYAVLPTNNILGGVTALDHMEFDSHLPHHQLDALVAEHSSAYDQCDYFGDDDVYDLPVAAPAVAAAGTPQPPPPPPPAALDAAAAPPAPLPAGLVHVPVRLSKSCRDPGAGHDLAADGCYADRSYALCLYDDFFGTEPFSWFQLQLLDANTMQVLSECKANRQGTRLGSFTEVLQRNNRAEPLLLVQAAGGNHTLQHPVQDLQGRAMRVLAFRVLAAHRNMRLRLLVVTGGGTSDHHYCCWHSQPFAGRSTA